MITILSGIGLLLLTLAGFSLFSLKMPKGQMAMSGMANAAIATFLVEAVHKYISGDLLGLEFFRVVGATSGNLGGVAAAIMVPISMGVIRSLPLPPESLYPAMGSFRALLPDILSALSLRSLRKSSLRGSM